MPLIGAAGVLVLPRKRAPSPRGEVGIASSDILLHGVELTSWGVKEPGEFQPHRLFDEAQRDSQLSEYCAALARQEPEHAGRMVHVPRTPGVSNLPAQGPSMRMLGLDPRRREECPICAEAWSKFTETRSHDGAGSVAPAAPAPVRRRGGTTTAKQGKMHSVRCAWAWFQQNLTAQLCALRFDVRNEGQPRSSPPSPSTVLPPPINDVVQHWRQQKLKADREAAKERTGKSGDPAVAAER